VPYPPSIHSSLESRLNGTVSRDSYRAATTGINKHLKGGVLLMLNLKFSCKAQKEPEVKSSRNLVVWAGGYKEMSSISADQ
jgi:hypothetical protein